MPQTNEHAFENYVETLLLSPEVGWQKGQLDEWDKVLALFPAAVLRFIQDTQPKLWAEQKKLHADGLEKLLIAALVKELDHKDMLHILRHGFKFHGKLFRVAHFKPAHGANYETLALFRKNRLTVTRQVPCHPNDNSKLDILLAVNGLPVASIELKNPNTQQNWRNAVAQYQQTRDPRALLFEFKKRTLVHFAADPNEIHMSTRLAGERTVFLPFNRGSQPGQIVCGAGNPPHPSGYGSGYFWQEVLQFESWLDILANFMFIERKDEKIEDGHGGQRVQVTERMVFPRYHQLDAVRKLVSATAVEGAGHNYLIQHSAGSGKTNTISWLAHRCASLHTQHDAKVFDCVIVITDRQVLDRQLQDAIYQIEHAQGVVKAIDQNAKQLSAALIDGTKIVVTTLQKFPFVLKGLLQAAGASNTDQASAEEKQQAAAWQAEIAKRRYAIIVDEAHSSQTGEMSRELKGILGSKSIAARSSRVAEDDEAMDASDTQPDLEDTLNEVLQSRGPQPNLSFFAFTATPKGKTLEIFGRLGLNQQPEAFHLYSMRQAIEEGFILDVLKNYTTYKTFYRVAKAISEDPKMPQKEAMRALTKFMSLHAYNIEQKIEIIITHFREVVKPQLNGKAKAMVVTSSRLHAVRYMQAFQRYLSKNNISDIRPLVAFSGKVKDNANGLEYTEPGMNLDCVSSKPIGEKQLPERFASPDYHVLLVANKYQTGFDQPLLCAMYVDKRLDGVQAVQTLSRLNRKIPGKETPFVLDFANEADDIYAAFKPYYDATQLQAPTEPSQLEAIKHALDTTQVYYWSEVEAFAQVFYKLPAKQRSSDHAQIERFLQPAEDRFNQIQDDAQRTEFYEKLAAFIKMYAFVSQIIPYVDADWEKLYSYGRLLLNRISLKRDIERVKLGNEVELQYYRLQRIFSGVIKLAEGEAETVKSPTEVGTGKVKDEKAPLSEIVSALNERFGTNFTEADRLFFQQIHEKAKNKDAVIKFSQANPYDKFRLWIEPMLKELVIERMAENDEIVTRIFDDKDFGSEALSQLARQLYTSIRSTSSQ